MHHYIHVWGGVQNLGNYAYIILERSLWHDTYDIWVRYRKHLVNIWLIFDNTSLAAKGALAHRLQRRTACKTQNGHQGAPKWTMGSGKGSYPKFLGTPVNFR